jgi:MFS family permease
MAGISKERSRTPRTGWVVLALSFLALFATLGVRMSFGAFVTAWESAFQVGRSEISLVSSISLVVFGLGMPVVGRLADRYGARAVLVWSYVLLGAGLTGCYFARSLVHLVFLYGIVASLGLCGGSSVVVSVAVLKWFPKRRTLAMSVTSCGIAAGQMVLAPLSLFLIRSYGWRETLALYGLCSLLLFSGLTWALFQDAPAEPSVPPKGAAHPGQASLRAPEAVPWWVGALIVVPYFFCGFTDLGFFATHFIPLAQGRGFIAALIASAVSLQAAANLGGNLLVGHLADRVRIPALLGTIYLIRAGTFAILYFASDPAALLVYALVNGIVDASTIAPTATLIAQTYGPGKVGTVFGLFSACHHFGGAAGAYAAGILFTGTGNYAGAIVLAAILLAFGATLCWIPRPRPAHAPR